MEYIFELKFFFSWKKTAMVIWHKILVLYFYSFIHFPSNKIQYLTNFVVCDFCARHHFCLNLRKPVSTCRTNRLSEQLSPRTAQAKASAQSDLHADQHTDATAARYQSINQSSKQAIDGSIIQSMNQNSIEESIIQSMNQYSIEESIIQSIN